MKTSIRFLSIFLFVLVFGIAPARSQEAGPLGTPPLPSTFWGRVTLNGTDAPAGTTVAAYVYDLDGVTMILCGGTTTYLDEEGHAVYVLSVNGDDNDTPGKSGAVDGDTVYFFIELGRIRVQAEQTGVWHSGAFPQLDLAGWEPLPSEYRIFLPLVERLMQL